MTTLIPSRWVDSEAEGSCYARGIFYRDQDSNSLCALLAVE
jgi:hypothetical protein